MNATETEHRCQNPKCRKMLVGRRSNTKYCDHTCRQAVVNAQASENEEREEVWISQACRYPKQGQAEIVRSDRLRRHPYSGQRPEWSGYCVIKQCECQCHPENMKVESD